MNLIFIINPSNSGVIGPNIFHSQKNFNYKIVKIIIFKNYALKYMDAGFSLCSLKKLANNLQMLFIEINVDKFKVIYFMFGAMITTIIIKRFNY